MGKNSLDNGLMKRRTLSAPEVPLPPFNAAPAVLAGDWIFVGGTMATDWRTGLEPSSRLSMEFPFNNYGIQLETHAIFRQISRLCSAAGSDVDHMVRIDQFSTDWDEFRHYFPVRDVYLTANRPASTAIAIRSLLVPEARLIIDGIAVVPHDEMAKEAINKSHCTGP